MASAAAQRAIPADPATFSQASFRSVALTGRWTALDMGDVERRLDTLQPPLVVDASGIAALDTAGAWVIQRLLQHARKTGGEPTFIGLQQRFATLMQLVAGQFADAAARPAIVAPPHARAVA